VRPVDRLIAAYNLLLGLLWLAVAARPWWAPWVAGAHLAATALPLALRRLPPSAPALVRVAREYYPLLWLVGFWLEMGSILPLLHPSTHDEAVAHLDLLLFRASWHTEWMRRAPSVWFSEVMHFLYLCFIPLVAIPPIVAGATGRLTTLRDLTFRLTLSYLACCLCYLVYPVIGPAMALGAVGAESQVFFFRLMGAVQGLGDSLGTSFPSSHVTASVTVALAAWRWYPQRVAVVLSALTTGIVLSTVYTRNHYSIDAAAGVVFAFFLQLVVAPVLTPSCDREPAR
jgi:membrane-associated phospholipid phosphatase